ncbi:MAG: Gmad2 immunoglobulin-like domain-containing protein [Patescibacteria group bacterium]
MFENKKWLIIIAVVLIGIGLVFAVIKIKKEPPKQLSNFEDCVLAGYPILESYPRQCRTRNNEIFIEDIGNELEKLNLIKLEQPRPNQIISTPVLVKGEAKGYWFFEASFPIDITDSSGEIIGSGIAQAQSDWMVEDFVRFEAEINFSQPKIKTGYLILKKDNPSGLPENDDQLRIPVKFK